MNTAFRPVLRSLAAWLALFMAPAMAANPGADTAPAWEATCPQEQAQSGYPEIASFPQMSEPGQDVVLAPGFQDCRAVEGSGYHSVVQGGADQVWISRARLLPSLPNAGVTGQLPPGWHWLELGLQVGRQ